MTSNSANLANSVWKTLFAKPPPVLYRREWESSPESKLFVLSPNVITRSGNQAEDYAANSWISGMLLTAYQHLLWELGGLDVQVTLSTGEVFGLEKLTPMANFQPVEGERAARLANSTISMDDSRLAGKFIAELAKSQTLYHLQIKVEWALLGKCEKITNRQFSDKLFDGFGLDIVSVISGVLMEMDKEGLIFNASADIFAIRMTQCGVYDKALDLRFRSLCKK